MPKDQRDRARRNSNIVPHRVIESDPESQPPLPARMPNGEDWPARPQHSPTGLRDLPAEVGKPRDQVLGRVRDEIAHYVVGQRRRTGGRPDRAAAQKPLGSRSGTDRTRSENARSASSCHSETSRPSCWCSSSASAVCSATISDIYGTGAHPRWSAGVSTQRRGPRA
jgi:hypothetical protein